jgi:hypothetical protein
VRRQTDGEAWLSDDPLKVETSEEEEEMIGFLDAILLRSLYQLVRLLRSKEM